MTRLSLGGTMFRPDPLLLQYSANDTFAPVGYTTLNFTHFEVICIGAGGGRGPYVIDGNARPYGGAGGGGGYHRVKGLLSALPMLCNIIVGTAGANAPGIAGSLWATSSDGGDGGPSSFNGTTCRASGGKGGKKLGAAPSLTVSPNAQGGMGGRGDYSGSAGGGAVGGHSGTPTSTGPGTPGTNGKDGSFINDIGAGGGGGGGGVYRNDTGVICVSGTSGGRGSFNTADLSVFGQGDLPTGALPGWGGGAKATPLTGQPTEYGKGGTNGFVVIRLTAE